MFCSLADKYLLKAFPPQLPLKCLVAEVLRMLDGSGFWIFISYLQWYQLCLILKNCTTHSDQLDLIHCLLFDIGLGSLKRRSWDVYLVARTFWRRGPLQCPRRMGMWEGSGSASERWAVELGSPETPGTFVPWGTGKPSLLFTSHLWWRTALPYEVPRMSTSLHVDHACTCSPRKVPGSECRCVGGHQVRYSPPEPQVFSELGWGVWRLLPRAPQYDSMLLMAGTLIAIFSFPCKFMVSPFKHFSMFADS